MNTYANRGRPLEDLIIFTNEMYERKGLAVVHKVPTEWLPIRGANGQIVSAKVEKKAAVDFLGVTRGGAIAFDAKHTKEDRINWKALEAHQAEFLGNWQKNGGFSFIIVSRRMRDFWLIPYHVWGSPGKSVALDELWPEFKIDSRKGWPDYIAAFNRIYGGQRTWESI